MIQRYLVRSIKDNLKKGNVTILYGARRTGKTTLMNEISSILSEQKVLILNGEDFDVANVLSSQKAETLRNLVTGYEYLFIDEAQNIPSIGKNLKLLIDTQSHISVFATGSASFELRGQLGEPLTGRSRFFTLYPFSLSEICKGYIDALSKLPELLIYGTYPQVFMEPQLKEKRHLLENIRNGYLLKDVLVMENIKDSLFIMNLLRLLAYQTGNDISYNELARNLNTTVKTIQRYLDILEKAFIIFHLNGYSRNLRKEISKSPRFYFWDNGIRNAVISDFSPVEGRNDTGKLWENFCISERIKKQHYQETFSNFYFWRTYDRQEIDLIETRDQKLFAFEFKWGNKITKVPRAFHLNYPDTEYSTINRESFFDFLM
jgi:predicted AAA+ superfamily ATPase